MSGPIWLRPSFPDYLRSSTWRRLMRITIAERGRFCRTKCCLNRSSVDVSHTDPCPPTSPWVSNPCKAGPGPIIQVGRPRYLLRWCFSQAAWEEIEDEREQSRTRWESAGEQSSIALTAKPIGSLIRVDQQHVLVGGREVALERSDERKGWSANPEQARSGPGGCGLHLQSHPNVPATSPPN